MPRKVTMDAIFVVRRMQEEYQKTDKKLYSLWQKLEDTLRFSSVLCANRHNFVSPCFSQFFLMICWLFGVIKT